ncbi:MAG: shikimate dehydrogenase [Candidatus Melainabacteria bacterium RIFCSPHIGHO2_02_FULL_34_12]|nr:MAG: shikimate dehydrogenase [Candidatus Melainabacteria bacterium RIFCSPHIGHO2_02_FULL_34_12]
MLKLGILGYPLEHTLSPVMQTAALQYLNISGEYKAYEVVEEELEKTFRRLKEEGIKGLNITIPYKKKIIPLLDELTQTAKLIGAVNTVTFENGRAIGDNTDVMGFWNAIPLDIKNRMNKERTVILGCGGSAYACGVALILSNAMNLKIYGRNKDKLEEFKKFLESRAKGLNINTNVEIGLFSDLNLKDTFLLINTTPVGMHPKTNETPVLKENLKELKSDGLVYDIIYNPPETKLLKDAKSLNLNTLNGIEMLISQGAASIAIWLGQKVSPIGAMRLAIKQNL